MFFPKTNTAWSLLNVCGPCVNTSISREIRRKTKSNGRACVWMCVSPKVKDCLGCPDSVITFTSSILQCCYFGWLSEHHFTPEIWPSTSLSLSAKQPSYDKRSSRKSQSILVLHLWEIGANQPCGQIVDVVCFMGTAHILVLLNALDTYEPPQHLSPSFQPGWLLSLSALSPPLSYLLGLITEPGSQCMWNRPAMIGMDGRRAEKVVHLFVCLFVWGYGCLHRGERGPVAAEEGVGDSNIVG